jgi:ABC-type proline/glycine betaine transport system substrate-binding protein
MSKAMQRVMCSMPGSRRQAAAQWLQARAQAWQAWMQRE